jgi:hypothetical protein
MATQASRWQIGGKRGEEELRTKRVRASLWALHFSLLFLFHIGWRELKLGNRIDRLQRLNLLLRPAGWVRVVSGVQSLLSVCLVALWALNYLGRPFELGSARPLKGANIICAQRDSPVDSLRRTLAAASHACLASQAAMLGTA